MFKKIIQLDLSAIVSEEFQVQSDTPGIKLYVRRKYLPEKEGGETKRVALFVHGASYPSEATFDLQLNGFSWMDYIALHGWDIYMMDLRGYGQSTRPPEMAVAPEENKPIVRTEVAVQDVAAVVQDILKRSGQEKLSLIGWSWGTTVMASFACRYPANIDQLVLYAPQWLRTTPSLVGGDGPLGAYRCIPLDTAKQRWLTGLTLEQQSDLIPTGWFESWITAVRASDQQGAQADPPYIRAPNGIIQDTRDFWLTGIPVYDPAMITVPTLIVCGEWDADTPQYMARGVFEHLSQALYKRLTVVGGGTHTLLLEKNRLQLFREVQLFLDEPKFQCSGLQLEI